MKMLMDTKRRLTCLLLAGCLSLLLISHATYGEDAWRADFDATCSQSNNAMALSVNELRTLIDKCENLQKIVEAQEETVRKVYSRRLQLCKNLYVFVLETKLQEQPSK